MKATVCKSPPFLDLHWQRKLSDRRNKRVGANSPVHGCLLCQQVCGGVKTTLRQTLVGELQISLEEEIPQDER